MRSYLGWKADEKKRGEQKKGGRLKMRRGGRKGMEIWSRGGRNCRETLFSQLYRGYSFR